MKGLYLLLTIIRRSDTDEYEIFFKDNTVSVVYETACSGTTHEKTLALWGIEKNEKTLLLSFMTREILDKVLRGLTQSMKIDLPDRGIAVAVPLSGVGGSRALEYFSSGQNLNIETSNKTNDNSNDKKEESEMQTNQDLIVAIYEKGYTDLVMDAARDAGAGGGTTIRAKGTGAGAEKFFGLSLAEEKEILLIVASNAQKKDIMKAIMQKAGIDSKAHSLVFSLPVTDTAGFRFADTVEKE